MFFMPDQLRLDMCPLLCKLHLGGALVAHDLHCVLLSLQLGETLTLHWGCPFL
jgi:hypothetical protein